MNPKKRTILIAGGVLLALAIYLLVFLVPDFVRSSVGPTALTMREAAVAATDSNSYVALTDGAWLCDTLRTVRGRTYSSQNRSVEITRTTEVFRADEAGGVILFVTFAGEEDCGTLPAGVVSGYLQRMSSAREQELTNEVRLARFINATDFLELCAYCGPTNSLIGVLFGLVFAASGIGLLLWALRL